MHRTLTLAAAAALLTGCGAISAANVRGATPRTGVNGSPREPVLQPALEPSRPDVPDATPRFPTAAGASAGQRRACRGTSQPRGWIAVAYESGSDCPPAAGRTGEHRVAILVQYTELRPDATLDVCADQGVPRNWEDVRVDGVDVGSCPGARKDGGSATRRIRKMR